MRSQSFMLGLGLALTAPIVGDPLQAHHWSGQEPVAIPEAFRGEWIADLKWCPPKINDEWISAKRMRFGHFVGEAKAVTVHGPRHITVAASLLSDGDPLEGDIDMKLSEMGDQLTINFGNGERLRYRCPH